LFALKPLHKNIYDEYLATILEKSRGQEILKVPLDVARDINLPAIVANNQKEERLAIKVMNSTPRRMISEFKSPPRIQRQETFISDSEEDERPQPKAPKSPGGIKSPPKLARQIKPSTLFTPAKIVQEAKEKYLMDKSYAKQLSETAKSQKASVDSQVGAIQFIGPQTAENALALDFSNLRI
jgi:hypothetical protein